MAYAATRMPATFGAVYAALFAALTEADLSPKTLLDVGAGTGAACWAAAALCDFSRITCLERESAMKNLGQALMRGGRACAPACCLENCGFDKGQHRRGGPRHRLLRIGGR